MAHEVETMAYTGQVPWHGLGETFGPNATPEEVVAKAGLNWTVDPHHLAFWDGSDYQIIPNQRAFVRSSDQKALTVASSEWRPLQNVDLIGFMKDYLDAGGATLETAGSLRGGSVVFVLAKINRSFEVSRGDRVEGYLLGVSPHKVGSAIKFYDTAVRVVCANTIAMATNGNLPIYQQSHLGDFDTLAAKAAVASTIEALGRAEGRAKTLKSLKISVAEAMENVLLPAFGWLDDDGEVSKSRVSDAETLTRAIREAPGADPGTGWGALNGVTYYTDHLAGREASGRLFRSWLGDLKNVKLEVEKGLLELV